MWRYVRSVRWPPCTTSRPDAGCSWHSNPRSHPRWYRAVCIGLQRRYAEYQEILEIVDILPTLQRERPNLFDGSDLEPGGDYADQWQLALPQE